MKSLLLSWVTLLSFTLCQGQIDFDGKKYYWEGEDLLYNKSVIEFRNDTIFIIDFPSFAGGGLLYRYGMCKIKEDSMLIDCEILKSVHFSTNTGTVISYTKNCNTKYQLQLTENGDLRKEYVVRLSPFSQKEEIPRYEVKSIDYRPMELRKESIDYKCIDRLNLKDYERSSQLRECNPQQDW